MSILSRAGSYAPFSSRDYGWPVGTGPTVSEPLVGVLVESRDGGAAARLVFVLGPFGL